MAPPLHTKWLPINREDSVTPAAAQLAHNFSVGGYKALVNLGQGNERELPKGRLGKMLSGSVELNPYYNTEAGGPMDVRTATARYFKSLYNIDAQGQNVFVTQTLGRTLLKLAFEVAKNFHQPFSYKNGHPPIALVPNLRWPTIDALLQKTGMQIETYDVMQPNITDAIIKTMDRVGSKNIALITTNFPHNPTSRRMTPDDAIALKDLLNTLNHKPDHKITLVDDAPYSYSAKPETKNGKTYLSTGFSSIYEADSPTPMFHIQSFSKSFGTANIGLSAMVVTDNLRIPVKRDMTNEGHGLARVGGFIDNIGTVLGGNYNIEIMNHFQNLRDKYETNRKTVRRIFTRPQDGIEVVEGRAGMLSLIKVPREILGRDVSCHDLGHRQIRTGYDLMEYFANQHGVVMVYNGEYEGSALIRVAQAAQPDMFEEGVERLNDGINTLLYAHPRLRD